MVVSVALVLALCVAIMLGAWVVGTLIAAIADARTGWRGRMSIGLLATVAAAFFCATAGVRLYGRDRMADRLGLTRVDVDRGLQSLLTLGLVALRPWRVGSPTESGNCPARNILRRDRVAPSRRPAVVQIHSPRPTSTPASTHTAQPHPRPHHRPGWGERSPDASEASGRTATARGRARDRDPRTQIRYRKLSDENTDYTVHCKDVRHGRAGILVALAADGVDLSEIEILSLSICFKFPRNNRDTKTVELTIPNRVTLDETDRDRYIESVLARWGFIDYAAKDRLARAGVAE